MPLDLVQYIFAAFSGALVAFSLGLVGGGGSILAIPLLIYLVGVPNPHVAIGTGALAVAASAATALISHIKAGAVKWRCVLMYTAGGIFGAFAGSTAGKAMDGERLLFLFAIVMVAVGIIMLRGRDEAGDPDAQCDKANAPKVVSYGLGSGAFSGFFGIGGGFLIVPGLIASTGMPIINAVGSSLVAVSAFGLTTAVNYAASGLIDWPLAAVFIGGGLFGGIAGAATAKRLSGTKGRLRTVFAAIIFIVAAYMLWKGIQQF